MCMNFCISGVGVGVLGNKRENDRVRVAPNGTIRIRAFNHLLSIDIYDSIVRISIAPRFIMRASAMLFSNSPVSTLQRDRLHNPLPQRS